MNAQELKDKYWSLYEHMASSRKTEYMKAFGQVMTDMMDDMIVSSPSKAEEYIAKLEAIKWDNYLTPNEAEKIVAEMKPKAPWSREVWKNAMDSLGLPLEKVPSYNSCALWTTMNMVYSDHAETIANDILKMPLSQIPADKIVKGIHDLATDLLCDEDGNFNIRKYFSL